MHWLLRQLAFLAFPLTGIVSEVSAAAPSTGCGKPPTLITPGAATTPLTLSHNNKERQYYVKMPADYDQNHPYRLVLTLHALMGTAEQVTLGVGGYLPWYGLPDQMNDTVGAIYIAPDGLNNGWANQDGEDVGFLQKAMQAVEGDLCVDQTLRFSTGFSYGAAMSYALACSLGKQIRAVAALSGNPMISGCSGGAEPVAYYGEHGVGDAVLPIAGGREMRDRFVRNNGCAPQEPPEPASGSGTHIKTTYAGCDPDYPVVWVAFDGDHTPQPMDRGVAATFAAAESWNFFSQFE
ncbi:carbohydrate esterase family 1 protein [Hypoxylon rubiginosum]|uniref:Carbohydrate esterase family 1 protein n=1 Tax=Hypoxylon rubiginosum TaxID=110542 RepID=A0ACB9ZCI5_9PEZI|nr:carbohydrate esterase family 1 protein [Hypoxylon rubiginosum]